MEAKQKLSIETIQNMLIGVIALLETLKDSEDFQAYSALFTTCNDLVITDAIQVLLEIHAEFQILEEDIRLGYESKAE